MLTLGIDLSSAPKGTAACLIKWTTTEALAELPALRCTDDDLDALIERADIIGIDAPFGWPMAFVRAAQDWKLTAWSSEIRKQLQFRATDLLLQSETGLWPLSVSTDRIALPAMRAKALLQRHNVTDLSGDGRFFEVYPAATLYAWGLDCRGYKKVDEKCSTLRLDILSKLRWKLPELKVSSTYVDTSDALDALIASLTARAAFQGYTTKPKPGQIAAAKSEGWIHVPTALPHL